MCSFKEQFHSRCTKNYNYASLLKQQAAASGVMHPELYASLLKQEAAAM
jgi:hypothetical protein